jgi:hypothetical protein
VNIEIKSDACPIWVVSEKEEDIARLNADLTWSVRWSKVIDQAFSNPTTDNIALNAICRLLHAARDNFRTSPWDEPIQPWDENRQFVVTTLEVYENETPPKIAFSLLGPDDVIAVVNEDGCWSVDWPQVLALSSEIKFTNQHPDTVPVLGFCSLLLGAKDNFVTKPFPTFAESPVYDNF